MQYRQAGNTGVELSRLGFGCMRFPRKGPSIDQEATEELLQAAIDQGITYFDTAYLYPGSEEALGKFIAKGHRDEMIIASKVPHYRCKKIKDFDFYLAEQLRRLKTDHIDFYLMHMLTDLSSWQRVKEIGAVEWLEKQQEGGWIRHLGFSYHGGKEGFKAIIDDYPWEFCQIQLNYQDANTQAGLEGLEYAAERGIPVIVMEPLRGGKLVDELPHSAKRIFEEAEPHQGPAAWGLQWLYNRPEVTCVLSGMNEMSQLLENCEVASRIEPDSLTPDELAVYDRVLKEIRRTEKVNCTGCSYCMPCPHGVDIPACFAAYNTKAREGWYAGLSSYIMTTSLKENPSNASRCVGCGRCESLCPQQISIRHMLKCASHALEGPAYHIATKGKGVFFKV